MNEKPCELKRCPLPHCKGAALIDNGHVSCSVCKFPGAGLGNQSCSFCSIYEWQTIPRQASDELTEIIEVMEIESSSYKAVWRKGDDVNPVHVADYFDYVIARLTSLSDYGNVERPASVWLHPMGGCRNNQAVWASDPENGAIKVRVIGAHQPKLEAKGTSNEAWAVVKQRQQEVYNLQRALEKRNNRIKELKARLTRANAKVEDLEYEDNANRDALMTARQVLTEHANDLPFLDDGIRAVIAERDAASKRVGELGGQVVDRLTDEYRERLDTAQAEIENLKTMADNNAGFVNRLLAESKASDKKVWELEVEVERWIHELGLATAAIQLAGQEADSRFAEVHRLREGIRTIRSDGGAWINAKCDFLLSNSVDKNDETPRCKQHQCTVIYARANDRCMYCVYSPSNCWKAQPVPKSSETDEHDYPKCYKAAPSEGGAPEGCEHWDTYGDGCFRCNYAEPVGPALESERECPECVAKSNVIQELKDQIRFGH